MITAVVNTLTPLKPEMVIDSNGAPVTTLVNGNWTKTARLLGMGTTAVLTITHVAAGIYDLSFTPTAVGNWSVEYSVTVDGEVVYFDPQFVQVETASQNDPAGELADQIDDLLAQIDNLALVVAGITAGDVTINSPVAISGNVTVYQGDDHYSVDSRHLSWSTSSEGQWPDLTGASISLRTSHRVGTEFTSVPGSVVTPTGSTKQVKVELTNAETTALRSGTYDYQLIATLANAHVVTLVEAIMTVKERRG